MNFKKLTMLLLALILAFSLTACLDPSEDGSDVETIKVTVSIIYPEAAEEAEATDDAETAEDATENIVEYEMFVEQSATALQILESFANQEGIPVEIEEADTFYVTSINGVSEYLEDGQSGGWIYEVNGESTETPASEYVAEDGDDIVWKFITF